jgi:hypothetical protein
MRPGAMPLMVTPYGPISRARLRMKPMIPPLLATECSAPGEPAWTIALEIATQRCSHGGQERLRQQEHRVQG